MLKGTTESGFEYEISDETLDDYELMEELAEIDNGNMGKLPGVIEDILGMKQKEKLKEHIKEEYGRVSISNMIKELTQILQGNKEGKNS